MVSHRAGWTDHPFLTLRLHVEIQYTCTLYSIPRDRTIIATAGGQQPGNPRRPVKPAAWSLFGKCMSAHTCMALDTYSELRM